jgi:hypothetical protein
MGLMKTIKIKLKICFFTFVLFLVLMPVSLNASPLCAPSSKFGFSWIYPTELHLNSSGFFNVTFVNLNDQSVIITFVNASKNADYLKCSITNANFPIIVPPNGTFLVEGRSLEMSCPYNCCINFGVDIFYNKLSETGEISPVNESSKGTLMLTDDEETKRILTYKHSLDPFLVISSFLFLLILCWIIITQKSKLRIILLVMWLILFLLFFYVIFPPNMEL